jgi:hypothetical protein
VIATQPWYLVSDDAGIGQDVGWLPSPAITFHFAGVVDIDEVKRYVDNSHVGGVYAPDQVSIDGTSFANPGCVNPANAAILDFTGPDFHRSDLTITLGDPVAWVFLSEAQFFGNAGVVPEPDNVALLLAGVSMLDFLARRRRS